MNPARGPSRDWRKLYRLANGLSVLAHSILAFLLLFAAQSTARALKVGAEPITWTQICGELLALLVVFHIPPLLNVNRYRPHAWIAAVVMPITLVLVLLVCWARDKSISFLIWALAEAAMGSLQSWTLCKIEVEESTHAKLAETFARWKPGPEQEQNPPNIAFLKRLYFWVAWIGIAANALFVLPLVFAPKWMVAFLGVQTFPLAWAQLCGLFLGLISVFYVPATFDPDRYRVFAWLAIIPSRASGVLICWVAVIWLGANEAFILGVLLDLPFAIIQTFILARLDAEQHPTQRTRLQRWWGPIAAVLAGLVIVGAVGWHKLLREFPQRLANDSMEEYFKHGSIGVEDANGLPYWIWITLPTVFPEHLPRPGGYSALGLIWEQGAELPVGFSRRKIGFDRVGLNCALCHAGSALLPGQQRPTAIVGAPATTADILGYQRFLFACANDPRFNANTLMPALARQTRLSLLDQFLYRALFIPMTRKALREQSVLWKWTYEPDRPLWGPGRIEPFNPIKVSILNGVDSNVKVGTTLGTSDMQALWRLGANPGRAFHWDGLNTDLREVVDSSALGDGATRKSIPRVRLRQLQEWIKTNQPPPFPYGEIDSALAAAGKRVYSSTCARCHEPGGENTGNVMQVAGPVGVGTDENRAQMWTPESAAAYNKYLGKRDWAFSHFRSTGGYVCVPLDGLWLRAPYLHNGSVPTLADLLKAPSERLVVFRRGIPWYDPKNVGFVSTGEEAERNGFLYDTRGRGNSNKGHVYGVDLSAQEKQALIEYLKTL